MIEMRKLFVGARSDFDKKLGDSSGKEICVHSFYDFNKYWKTGKNYILRIRSNQKRKDMANFGKQIANNNLIGYSQAKRYTLLEEAKKNKMKFKTITKKCACDCSSMVMTILRKQGFNISQWTTTANLITNMKLAGIDFEVIPYESQKQLKYGDILLNTVNHVVIVA